MGVRPLHGECALFVEAGSWIISINKVDVLNSLPGNDCLVPQFEIEFGAEDFVAIIQSKSKVESRN